MPGGGSTMAWLEMTMADKLMEAMADEDERAGAKIILKSLSAPLKQIAKNAGIEGAVVLANVQKQNEFHWGWDASKMDYCDLMERGVVDPAKVTINALENSASVAGLILTTECLVTEIPVEKTEAQRQQEFDDSGMMAGMQP